MIMRFIIACCVATLAAAPAPLWADQVHFTGTTRVDAVVIHDALQQVLTVAAATERCNQLTAVEARPLPPGYRPPHPSDAIPSTALYEWWDTTLCGRTVPFVLGFWPAPEGGYMFAVIYLYPNERTRP